MDHLAPFMRIIGAGSGNSREIEKMEIRRIIDYYVNKYFEESSLRDDSFVLLAYSIVLKKQAARLKQTVKEKMNSLFLKKEKGGAERTHQPGKRRQQQRREQIVGEDQLLKLPSYLQSQENSQLAEEQSISLNEAAECSKHSQLPEIHQAMEMEVEEFIVEDHRKMIADSDLKSVRVGTETKEQRLILEQTGEVYQKMMELMVLASEEKMEYDSQVETAPNSRKKKAQMDRKQQISLLHYRSQFIDEGTDERELARKLEQYIVREWQMRQSEILLGRRDELLSLIMEVMEESSVQEQLASILNPEDEKYLNRSEDSVKSILKRSRMEESNEKSSFKKLRFELELEQIQEELSHHYTTSMSHVYQSHNVSEYMADKSAQEKAQYFYNILLDSKRLGNIRISQKNKETFGPISVQFRE